MEHWCTVKGYPNYSVSNTGLVKNNKTNFFLKPIIGAHGYLKVSLCRSDGIKQAYIHRLVCSCFLENSMKGTEVNHKNGDKADNDISNLEWISRIGNMKHAKALGLFPKGEKKYGVILSASKVKEILRLHKNRLSCKKIGIKFSVSGGHIWKIIKGGKWSHVTYG